MDTYKVLFLCTGNSARSIMAEALLNDRGQGRFRAFSAGSFPKGAVHPLAIETLARSGLATDGLRSKSWNEFAGADAPRIDFVVTVCDNAAAEPCPVWPGAPVTAHWGIADPAAVAGADEDRRRAFTSAFHALDARIRTLVSLPPESLQRTDIGGRLNEIGAIDAGTATEPPSDTNPSAAPRR